MRVELAGSGQVVTIPQIDETAGQRGSPALVVESRKQHSMNSWGLIHVPQGLSTCSADATASQAPNRRTLEASLIGARIGAAVGISSPKPLGSLHDRRDCRLRCEVLERDAGQRSVERSKVAPREALMGIMNQFWARTLRTFIAATMVALCFAAGGVSTGSAASAAPPDCAGRGVPTSKISIQLWTFADYIGFGTDAATIARTEEVFGRLSEMGYRNVEPFTLSGLTAEQYRALLDKYGLNASARHVNVGTPQNPADIDQILGENQTLGIKYFGSGSTPIFPPTIYTTEAEWIAYAEYLNELGALARQRGQTLMVHNHDIEFETVFGNQTAFDILMAYTDPKNVVFQLDLYWATNGGGLDNPIDMIEQYGNRIKLFHVKDMAGGAFPGRIEIVGDGIIDFPSIFEAAGGSTKYYVVEHDPRFGDPTFNPFEAAQQGFDYLDCVTF